VDEQDGKAGKKISEPGARPFFSFRTLFFLQCQADCLLE
jgi:hypothetical protein